MNEATALGAFHHRQTAIAKQLSVVAEHASELAPRLAERHDPVHVGGMAAHMADDHRLHAVQLGLEIVHIEPVVAAHFAEHRHTFGMDHGRGHGGKGEPGDQHLCVARQTQRLER